MLEAAVHSSYAGVRKTCCRVLQGNPFLTITYCADYKDLLIDYIGSNTVSLLCIDATDFPSEESFAAFISRLKSLNRGLAVVVLYHRGDSVRSFRMDQGEGFGRLILFTEQASLSAGLRDEITRFLASSVFGLTNREVQVLKLQSEGYSVKETAGILSISTGTVKVFRKHISRKTGTNKCAVLTRIALMLGISSLDDIPTANPVRMQQRKILTRGKYVRDMEGMHGKQRKGED